jgi:RNA polymerase sigma-70 factor (ECF subfamily)
VNDFAKSFTGETGNDGFGRRMRSSRARPLWYVPAEMTDALTDGELVRRIARREGARQAEAELCRRFAPRVRLYGIRHLRSEDRAADLVQGVLLAVIEAARAGRIEEPDKVDRFVLGTCRNVALRVREGDARLKPADPAELDVATFTPDFERVDVGALLQCIGKLDGRARTVVMLSYQADRSADDIAKLLETSAGNVRVVRHRALSQLRACLDAAGGALA